MKPKTLILLALGLLLALFVGFVVLKSKRATNTDMTATPRDTRPLDLSGYAATAPSGRLRLLFIHHSCGGQLLAAPGPDVGTNCIYLSHPNGGDLRAGLEAGSYEVHEVSYGSRLGEKTDIPDWPAKFRGQMDQILTCDSQDTYYTDGRRNQIVVFKSCYPNNLFTAAGSPPGDPHGSELTVWNAKAAYAALLEEFRKQSKVLFVCVTAPPLAPKGPPQPRWKQWAGKALGWDNPWAPSAPLAAEFNHWLSDTNGWLKDYAMSNVVVFDYYHMLSAKGGSGFSDYPTGDGYDSHPSHEGNRKSAEAFVPFLNRAARRAGLTP
jgi:hypothetical protein